MCWCVMQDEQRIEDVAAARRIVGMHQDRTCPLCTDDGCPAEDSAVPLLFNAVVAGWPAGPKTLAEVEQLAREVRGNET